METDLKERLRLLRRQSGAATEPPSAREDGIARRVQRLRACGSREACGADGEQALAALLGGTVCAPGVIRVDRRIALGTRHGRWPLAQAGDAMDALPDAPAPDATERIYLDTETTGLAGGTGTVVFLLGLARLRAEHLEVCQFLITRFAAEAALLTEAARWMEGAAGLVTFNGRRFDVPLLAARCRMARVPDPFSPLPHLDLLYPVRRAFRSRWEDCRLITAERRLLCFTRTDDLPGSAAPQAWLDYVRGGQCARLPAVARHNLLDLISLAVLPPALCAAHLDPLRWDADPNAVARAHLRRGNRGAAFATLHGHAEGLDEAARLTLARLHQHRGDWSAARAIWEALAGSGCTEALERLAKYHEHVQRDYDAALSYARRLPPTSERARRLRRLRQRLAANGGGGTSTRPLDGAR